MFDTGSDPELFQQKKSSLTLNPNCVGGQGYPPEHVSQKLLRFLEVLPRFWVYRCNWGGGREEV